MDRTCKGQPYRTLQDNLVDEVNLEMRFRCLQRRPAAPGCWHAAAKAVTVRGLPVPIRSPFQR